MRQDSVVGGESLTIRAYLMRDSPAIETLLPKDAAAHTPSTEKIAAASLK